MSVEFQQIPANVRRPLFYAETNNALANTEPGANLRALIIGPMIAAGTGVANVAVQDQGVAAAKTLYGPGSIGAQMADTYRQNDTYGELWHLPVADDGAATAATGSITFTGPATAAGVLSLYLAGQLVSVAVTSAMTAAQLATAAVAAIAANGDLPVTAAVDGVTLSKVNLTAKNKGLCGNDIDIRVNYRGAASGEALPAGIQVATVAMAAGATNPSLAAGLAALGQQPFEFIVSPFTDATSIAAITQFLSDTAGGGRWAWNVGLFGHCFIAFRGNNAAQATFGSGKNDPHLSCIGFYDSPTPEWRWAAALAAQAAISVRADAAQPIREVALQGVLAPPVQSRLSGDQRNTLLFDGISTFDVDPGGNVVIEKLITTYQLNGFGQPDNSYLDAETLFNIAYVLRDMRAEITSTYGRTKLAADSTRLAPGRGVTTPNMIKATLISRYLFLESQGYVQASDEFAAGLQVVINGINPNRVDVLWPGILVGRLDVFAVLNQFRLAA